jgi:hypothetical protein
MEVKKWKAMFGGFFLFEISLSLSQKKTSTITNIRIQKLFVIGNYFFSISQIKKQQRMSV